MLNLKTVEKKIDKAIFKSLLNYFFIPNTPFNTIYFNTPSLM